MKHASQSLESLPDYNRNTERTAGRGVLIFSLVEMMFDNRKIKMFWQAMLFINKKQKWYERNSETLYIAENRINAESTDPIVYYIMWYNENVLV